MNDQPAVLVPDRWGGVAVCDLAQLLGYLDEGQSLEDATTNAAFDSSQAEAASVMSVVKRVWVDVFGRERRHGAEREGSRGKCMSAYTCTKCGALAFRSYSLGGKLHQEDETPADNKCTREAKP